MELQTVSIFVDSRLRAVGFSTSRPRLIVTANVPMGEHCWLTGPSSEQPCSSRSGTAETRPHLVSSRRAQWHAMNRNDR
jgi:hypothetical protein